MGYVIHVQQSPSIARLVGNLCHTLAVYSFCLRRPDAFTFLPMSVASLNVTCIYVLFLSFSFFEGAHAIRPRAICAGVSGCTRGRALARACERVCVRYARAQIAQERARLRARTSACKRKPAMVNTGHGGVDGVLYWAMDRTRRWLKAVRVIKGTF